MKTGIILESNFTDRIIFPILYTKWQQEDIRNLRILKNGTNLKMIGCLLVWYALPGISKEEIHGSTED